MTVRVLVIDDNDVDRERIRRLLGSGHSVVEADSVAAASVQLSAGALDCALLDHRMPTGDGVAALESLCRFNVPIIVLTGMGDTALAVEAMRRGAEDYIPKHALDANVLPRSIAGAIERQRLRRELAARDAQLRMVGGQLPAVVWTTDCANRLTSLLGARLGVLGLDEPMIGSDIAEVFARIDDIQRVVRAHADAVAGTSTELDARLAGRAVRVTMAPLRTDADHAVAGVIGIAVDISESRSLELQLRQAQRLEALGHLAGSVAHDLNNVLAAISGFGNLARESLASRGESAHDLDDLLRSAERGRMLIRRLMMFARRTTFVSSTIDATSTIAATRSMLQRLLGAAIDLELDIPSRPVHVRIDPTELEQLLLNLIVNARDATPMGGVVTLSLSNRTIEQPMRVGWTTLPAGRYAIMHVIDSGIGISAEVLERVFEPFFTTKEHGRGTGLGLSTCYGIVQRAGGAITIASIVDEGTDVEIWIPEIDEPVPQRTAATDLAAIRGGSETLLYVEDDPDVRCATERLLQRLGYRVLPATDVASALATERDHHGPLDLILTDVVLPGGSGVDVVRDVSTRRPAVRSLYMSGYAGRELLREDSLGGAPIVHKPVEFGELARRLRAMLDG